MFLCFGIPAVGGLILGPLFWLGHIQPADGRPGEVPGIILSLVSGFFFMPLALSNLFDALRRRTPFIRLYREGMLLCSHTPVMDMGGSTGKLEEWRKEPSMTTMIPILFHLDVIIQPIIAMRELMTGRAFYAHDTYLTWEEVEAVEIFATRFIIYRKDWESLEPMEAVAFMFGQPSWMNYPYNVPPFQFGQWFEQCLETPELRETFPRYE